MSDPSRRTQHRTYDVLHVSCDEAGYTGPDLLHNEQPFFSYASIAISDEEATDIIQKARAAHPLQIQELKARMLIRSRLGRELIAALLSEIEGRYIVNVYDKLLTLCAWFFAYIYEPVYRENPELLYEKNLHRFVTMYTWLWMNDNESQARQTIEQFQRYMRSRNRKDAPFLFNTPRPPLTDRGTEHPFEWVLRFAYGYREIIIADNAKLDAELPEGGRWTLDLSSSSLWSHLNYWGANGKLLSVRCDASKPLRANIGDFTGDENDPGIRRARAAHNSGERLGWRLLEPITFVDSRRHPAVQLADVIAGTMVAIIKSEFSPEFQTVSEMISRHVHPHSMLPDMEIIDPVNRSAAVNSLILYDLAKRAERHDDPYVNLLEMYQTAERAWAGGGFGRFRTRTVRYRPH